MQHLTIFNTRTPVSEFMLVHTSLKNIFSTRNIVGSKYIQQ